MREWKEGRRSEGEGVEGEEEMRRGSGGGRKNKDKSDESYWTSTVMVQ